MIFVTDRGQMCNNLFQYIQLYAWGREHGRKTMSMRFAYKYSFWEISNYPYHNFFFHCMGKVLASLKLIPTIDFDRMGSLDEGLNAISANYNCLVKGWSYIRLPHLVEKYIADIRKMFAFKPEILAAAKARMDSDTDIHIGLHIRRGDYCTFKNGAFNFSDEEYVAYVNKLLSLLPVEKKKTVYICTNDQSLNKKYYEDNVSAKVLFPNGNGGEDLCLLSECQYLLGPTSSYSLVSTLYGKARLHWMLRWENIDDVQLDSFEGFNTLSMKMDNNFIDAEKYVSP